MTSSESNSGHAGCLESQIPQKWSRSAKRRHRQILIPAIRLEFRQAPDLSGHAAGQEAADRSANRSFDRPHHRLVSVAGLKPETPAATHWLRRAQLHSMTLKDFFTGSGQFSSILLKALLYRAIIAKLLSTESRRISRTRVLLLLRTHVPTLSQSRGDLSEKECDREDQLTHQ
jgi:hypothetical protein